MEQNFLHMLIERRNCTNRILDTPQVLHKLIKKSKIKNQINKNNEDNNIIKYIFHLFNR